MQEHRKQKQQSLRDLLLLYLLIVLRLSVVYLQLFDGVTGLLVNKIPDAHKCDPRHNGHFLFLPPLFNVLYALLVYEAFAS